MLSFEKYAEIYDTLNSSETGRKLIGIINGLIPGMIRVPVKVPVRRDHRRVPGRFRNQ